MATTATPTPTIPVPPRLTCQTAAIAPETLAIRALDWDRARFDIEFSLDRGTTYNAFLIQAAHVALVDTVHAKFRTQWMELLRHQVDLTGLRYLIVSHTEPDHSGLIQDILMSAPNIIVVGTKVALQFLEDWVHIPFAKQVVKNGDQIDLGQGHVLEFVMAPNLHWPDTMLTYDHKTGVLFTCDVFGMHYCDDALYDEDLSQIESHFQFYYDCLMGPNARSVLSGMKRMAKLPPPSLIATGHGPLLKHHWSELIHRYQQWSQEQAGQRTTVALFSVPGYGYSDTLLQAVSKGVQKTGVLTEWVDLITMDLQDIRDLVSEVAGLVLCTPPLPDITAQTAVKTILATVTPKQGIGLVTSCGSNDEPIDPLMNCFRDLGLKPGFEPIRIQGTPTALTEQLCEEAGTDLAQMVLKRSHPDPTGTWDMNLDEALGRLASGLYVVTAQQGACCSAMLASWVTQASQDPPGLTIAVAKDRAIESLLHVGDSFVLNVLEEGRHLNVMRHFLKWFAPGADRFSGIATQPANNGGIILTDSLAYLECEVKSRMVAGDHWLIYTQVSAGRVSNPDALTAAHFRKAGSHY